MLNKEKYSTLEVQKKAFETYCLSNKCDGCKLLQHRSQVGGCAIAWLWEEHTDVMLMPCPCCGSPCEVDGGVVTCSDDKCWYSIGATGMTTPEVVALHNKMCKATAGQKGA